MILYDLARRAKHVLKEYQKSRDCEYITPVRRIEKVFPPHLRRVVAMTFDDTNLATGRLPESVKLNGSDFSDYTVATEVSENTTTVKFIFNEPVRLPILPYSASSYLTQF